MPSYDPRKILNTANSFLLAADRSMEQRPLGPGQFQMLLVPAIVSQAFAIELCLKAIVNLEGGSANGHNLSNLLSGVSAQSRQKLQVHLSLDESALAQRVGAVSNAFTEWRYIFESESASVDGVFLQSMGKAAKAIAEELLASVPPGGHA